MIFEKTIKIVNFTFKNYYSHSSIFIVHGPGPLPILKSQIHKQMYSHLNQIGKKYRPLKGIVLISAHWQEKQWTILDQDNPGLYYDYGNFPPQAFKLQYPAHSTENLRNEVKQHLKLHNYDLKIKKDRGYDHGVFIPLMIAYPQADVPIIQISMLQNLDPIDHYNMGKALRGLKEKGYMIMGSGSSTHGAFRQNLVQQKSKTFDQQLTQICLQKYDQEKIKSDIVNWRKICHAEYLHPREQHLIPLFVNLGAYQGKSAESQKFFDQTMQLHQNFKLQGIKKYSDIETVKELLNKNRLQPTYISLNSQKHQKNQQVSIDLSVYKQDLGKINLQQQVENLGIKCVESQKIKVNWFPRQFNDLNKMGFKLLTWNKDRYHSQFSDDIYVRRREKVAQLMLNYKYGDQIPDIQYLPQQFQLWITTYRQLKKLHKTCMVERYRVGLDKMQKALGLNMKIPQLNEISQFLEGQTGFRVRPTHGILNKRDFLNSLAFRTIFSTQFIRNRKNPQFCPQSDLLHECLGHIPLLTDKYVADIFQKIGVLSLGASNEGIDKLSKVYWYLIQFGVCPQDNQLKGYGAGLASSIEQMENLRVAKFQRINPEVDCVTPYNDQKVLQTYRTTQSLQEALDILLKFAQNIPRPVDIKFNYNTKTAQYSRSIQALQQL